MMSLGVLVLAVTVAIGSSRAAGHSRRGGGQQCAGAQYPAARNPSNPLELPAAPGPNPLHGAHFFVDGPAHGAASSEIVKLLGLNPASFPNSYPWADLRQQLDSGRLHNQLAANPGLAFQVRQLEKIASQPEAQRFSLYSGGGGPGKILQQVHKIFCQNLSADPGAVPIVSTFFLYQAGYCESKRQILAHRPNFERQVNEMAAGTGSHPAVYLLELDAIGSSGCMARTGALRYWEGDIRYEVDKMSALPHTVVYVEGGYSDAESPAYTARALNAVGVGKIRGFFTNESHLNWTINEVRWAEKVSRMTHGATSS